MLSRGQNAENAGGKRLVRPVALSVLIGAVTCTLVLLIMSAVMAARSVPQAVVNPMAGLALIAGGLASGFCCAKQLRANGLACGALCGAVLAVIVLLAGFALQDNGFGVPALLKLAFVLLSAMLGGVLGVNTKKRRAKKRKQH